MTIGITGHQNLPELAVPFIREQVDAELANAAALRCVSSLAKGADQLFAQLALQRAAALHVVVPCAHYETTFSSDQDRMRFDALLRQAATTETLPFARPSEQAFLEAGKRVVDLSELLIAVWDGEVAEGKGGTGDIVAYARRQQKPVAVIWPAGVRR